ncbi:MAG: hypothetical protein V4615_17750 [Bacteroidota bacterium]
MPGFKDYFQTLTTYKNELRDGSDAPIGGFPAPPAVAAIAPVLAGVFKRNTELVRTIKAHPAYTETMGQNLGIIGAEIDPDFGTIQPEPKTSLKNAHAYLRWSHEHTEAADVYADYGDGAGFVLAGRISSTHYLDPHLPAAGVSKVYKYKLRYVVNDEQVGVESNPVSITVTG